MGLSTDGAVYIEAGRRQYWDNNGLHGHLLKNFRNILIGLIKKNTST